MIDLRSDTVTMPTEAMRTAIAGAAVGDDVFRDDPTVLELEAKVAAILGKDDAVYVPSGTMANQIAIRTHTQPGDVVLAAKDAHIGHHEMGAPAALSGVTIRTLPTTRGTFDADAVLAALPDIPEWMPASLFEPVTLLECENTHNAAGGAVWPVDRLAAVAGVGRDRGLATHLDGARLWNAAVATGRPEAEIASPFDTVSVCFSKGLGAPMGSALAGGRDLIETARRFKQMYGGGFRQAGMMAAGAIYALDHHRERLADDHANATRLAAGIAEIAGLDLAMDAVDTNMIYFTTSRPATEFCSAARDKGVAMLPMGPHMVRAVTNLDVTTDDIDAALAVFTSVA